MPRNQWLTVMPREAEDLAAVLAGHQLGHSAEVGGKRLNHDAEQALLRVAPFVLLQQNQRIN